jgi:hypothetical protein
LIFKGGNGPISSATGSGKEELDQDKKDRATVNKQKKVSSRL